MARLGAALLEFARGIGGPGLFVVAFLDSSFLSLPQINDLLVIWMVTRQKPLMVYYATMATLGSVAGCGVMYALGRRGGEALVRRRFRTGHIDRAMGWYRQYGALTLIVGALLPPPAPFKLLILLAGASRVPVWTFVAGVGVGRATRFFGVGLLAIWYGDVALEWIETHGRLTALVLALAALGGGLVWYVMRRRRRSTFEGTDGTL